MTIQAPSEGARQDVAQTATFAGSRVVATAARIAALVCLAPCAIAAADPPEIRVVAQATPDNPRNDSASIAELEDGKLLLVWMEFVRSGEAGHDTAPNRIVSMRSSDEGATWGERKVMVEPREGELNVYNPSLLRLDNGDILFTYLAYNELEWGAPLVSSGFVRRSTDGGRTFGGPRMVWDHKPHSSANNTLVQLASGRVIRGAGRVPIWGGPKGHEDSGCFYSDDHGRTWTPSSNWVELPLRGAMESHVAQIASGELVMTMRTQLGSVFLARSTDKGVTWSKAQTTGLRSGESMPALVRIPSTDDLLLVWNHSFYDPAFDHFGKRTPLATAISKDGGRTWSNIQYIETKPDWEYSNPAINFTSSGLAIITYFASKMDNAEPPGALGRSAMTLKSARVRIDWFYE